MPYIKVDAKKLSDYSAEISTIKRNVNTIANDFAVVRAKLDADIKQQSDISRKMQRVANDLSGHKNLLTRTSKLLSSASTSYKELDKNLFKKDLAVSPIIFPTVEAEPEKTPENGFLLDTYSDWTTIGAITASVPTALSVLSVATDINQNDITPPPPTTPEGSGDKKDPDYPNFVKGGMEDILDDTLEKFADKFFKEKHFDDQKPSYFKEDKNGNLNKIDEKDAPDFFEKKATILEVGVKEEKKGSIWELAGDQKNFDKDETGGYLGVGVGECSGSVSAGLYVIGKDGEKHLSPGINAEIGGSFSVLKGEVNGQVLGDDNLGLDLGGSLEVGTVGGKAEVGLQLFKEDGSLDIQAGLEVKAEALVAEITGKVNVDILGADITGEASVNFGIGAHLDVGIRDGVVKVDIGASLGIGVSVNLEVDIGKTVNAVVEGAKSVWNTVTSWKW